MKTEKRTRTVFTTLVVIVCVPMVAAAQTASFKALGVIHSSNPQNCCYAVSADGSTVLGTVLDAENEYRAQRFCITSLGYVPDNSQTYYPAK